MQKKGVREREDDGQGIEGVSDMEAFGWNDEVSYLEKEAIRTQLI